MTSPVVSINALLATLPLFMGASREEIERIALGTRQLNPHRGQVLFNKGDSCEGFHLVVHGQVRLVVTSPRGSEKVIDIIGPGETFGEALMFMGQPYIVYAQALANSLVLSVSKNVVFQEIERSPQFALKMIASLCSRIHRLVREIEAQSLQSGTQRFLSYLLRDSEARGVTKGSFTVVLPATKSTIASRLNLTPEHFSRILRDLESRKLIESDGRRVHIGDVDKLKKLS